LIRTRITPDKRNETGMDNVSSVNAGCKQETFCYNPLMPNTITLQKELTYFEKYKPEYLKLYKGQFVLIKGEQLVQAFTTDQEAYRAGLEKFGNQPFLIKQVLEDDTKVSYPALTVGVINIHP
jgi:hypothetical protein